MFLPANKIATLQFIALCIVMLCTSLYTHAQTAAIYSQQGWLALEKDNDSTALRYFNLAYQQAAKEGNDEQKALALLRIGICYYPVSYSKGLDYAMKAMKIYEGMEKNAPLVAAEGRGKCLQLISTIKSRQGKYNEAIALSRQAAGGFNRNDTTGYMGLIYNSLGSCYGRLGQKDSSIHYHQLALAERQRRNDYLYLPTSLLAVADIALERNDKEQSIAGYQRALSIADSTGNRQAIVSAMLAIGKWCLTFDRNNATAEDYYKRALTISIGLTDKAFYLKCLNRLLLLEKERGNYQKALSYKDEIEQVNDTLHGWETQKSIQLMEVRFDMEEKNRQLELTKKESEVRRLTGYLLGGLVIMLLAGAGGAIYFLRRINRRDKQLLVAKEALMRASEEQKLLREQQMQQEIEFKESQLSALTLQMIQRHELLQELKDKLEAGSESAQDHSVQRILERGLEGAQEWNDFNSHFESINQHFYKRLKSEYPDISPNDLKMCALIKMNLSIKEMAAVLNISPDSVKTARYRLRKKLQLNTEDNLTDFILSL
jgi:tetratricopeptide (TPR) repeat protein